MKKSIIAVLLCCLVTVSNTVAEQEVTEKKGFTLQAWNPNDDSMPSTSTLALRLGKGLLLCLGTLAIGLHFYKRFSGTKGGLSGRRLQIVERLAISQKGSILLVKVDGKEVLVGIGSDSPRLLSPMTSLSQDGFISQLGSLCTDADDQDLQSSQALAQ